MRRDDLQSSSVTGCNSSMYLTVVLLFCKKVECFILESPSCIMTALPDKLMVHIKGIDRRGVPTGCRVLRFFCWRHPCQLLVASTSSTSVVTVVESLPGGVHSGGYCVLLPPLRQPPLSPPDILLQLVMVYSPSNLESIFITGGR